MVEAVDHGLGSTAVKVGGGAIDGAMGGLGVIAGVALLAVGAIGGIVAIGLTYGLAVAAGVTLGVAALTAGTAFIATSTPFLAVLGIGAGLGALNSGSKVIDQKGKYNQLTQNSQQNINAEIMAAQQQAYAVGMQQGHQAGQEAVLDRLQTIQQKAIAEQQRLVAEQQHNHHKEYNDPNINYQTNHVARYASDKQNVVKPQAIVEQQANMNNAEHGVA